MSAYGPAHIALAKHVMRFLKTTQTLPLILRGGYELGMQVFTDATHAGDPDTRRSITSIVIKVNGNTVFWTCQYQQIVSHQQLRIGANGTRQRLHRRSIREVDGRHHAETTKWSC